MTKMSKCAREKRSRNLFNGRVKKRIVAVFIITAFGFPASALAVEFFYDETRACSSNI